MRKSNVVALLVILAQATLSNAACDRVYGVNKDMPCSYNVNPIAPLFEYARNTIEVCKPNSHVSYALDEWIFSDGNLSREVGLGFYDHAVVRIWRNVWALYSWSEYRPFGDKRYGGESCDSITPSDLLGYSYPSVSFGGKGSVGVSVHWSGLVYSLLRTLGVPSERVQVWEYSTPPILPSYPDGVGHAVVAYKTDSDAHSDWWVIDTTCCQSLVWLNDWKSLCSPCSCADGGCVAAVTDSGVYADDPYSDFKFEPFAAVCDC
jgi:hypothetical protein